MFARTDLRWPPSVIRAQRVGDLSALLDKKEG